MGENSIDKLIKRLHSVCFNMDGDDILYAIFDMLGEEDGDSLISSLADYLEVDEDLGQ